MTDERLTPYRIEVPQEQLDDLQARLALTRWASPEPDGTGWDLGVPVSYVRGLVERWRTGYDWRATEARLNAHPQFVTTIDGERVHVLHVGSPEPGALPLLLLHGWPGSVVEFLPVLGPLSDPRRHGGAVADAFDVVVPSLPGFAFSGPLTAGGWGVQRMAEECITLMERLGHAEYVVAGNDWGAEIAVAIGRLAPQRCRAIHVTQIVAEPLGIPGELDDLTADESAALAARKWVAETFGTYHLVQEQQPQTLAHALTDSPAGWLGWVCQIFREGSDADFALDNVTAHWLFGTVASAMRLYRESAREPRPTTPSTVPLGLSNFRDDYQSIRRFAERDHARIAMWRSHDVGDHYAAHSAPEVLVADLREFFAPYR